MFETEYFNVKTFAMEAVKAYTNEFYDFIVDDVYHEYLDFLTETCESFTLKTCLANYYENIEVGKLSDPHSINQIDRIIRNKYAGKSNLVDPYQIIGIPEYEALKINLISVSVIDRVLGIEDFKYEFRLNAETRDWLKKIGNFSEVGKRAVPCENDNIEDVAKYRLYNIDFIKNGDDCVFQWAENILVKDVDAERYLKMLVRRVGAGRKKLFDDFRKMFEDAKRKGIDRIDDRIKGFDPKLYVPNIYGGNLYDFKDAKAFYKDEKNKDLLSRLFIKSGKYFDINNLCFKWYVGDEPTNTRSNKREEKWNKTITEYLLSLDKKDLIALCESQLRNPDIFEYGYYGRVWKKIAEICNKKKIRASEFSYPYNDIFRHCSEKMPNKSITRVNAKWFVLRLIYKDIFDRIETNSHTKPNLYGEISPVSPQMNEYDLSNLAKNSYLYYYGYGVRKNRKKAYEGFLKLADTYPDCQYDLAKCYLNGWGTEKDIEQAKHWFEVAASNGHSKAREQLDRIEKSEHNGR